MNETMQNVIIPLLAAIGGGGAILQLVRLIQAWRDGIKIREDEAEERLLKRYEVRIQALEYRADLDADYIRRLVHALGTAGIPIPSRKEMTNDREEKNDD